GDYSLSLSGTGGESDAPYTVSVDALDPFDLPVDTEPNNAWDQARPVPADLVLVGISGGYGADDWYRLPPQAKQSETLVRKVRGPDRASGFVLSAGADGRTTRAEWNEETQTWTLPVGSEYVVTHADTEYELALTIDGVT